MSCAAITLFACSFGDGYEADANDSAFINSQDLNGLEQPGKLAGNIDVELEVVLESLSNLGPATLSSANIVDETQEVSSNVRKVRLVTRAGGDLKYIISARVRRQDNATVRVDCLSRSQKTLNHVTLEKQDDGTYRYENVFSNAYTSGTFYPLDCAAFRANVTTTGGSWTNVTVLNPVTPRFIVQFNWGKVEEAPSFWFTWEDNQDPSRLPPPGTIFGMTIGEHWIPNPNPWQLDVSSKDAWMPYPVELLTEPPQPSHSDTSIPAPVPTATRAPQNSGVFGVYFHNFFTIDDKKDYLGVHFYREQALITPY